MKAIFFRGYKLVVFNLDSFCATSLYISAFGLGWLSYYGAIQRFICYHLCNPFKKLGSLTVTFFFIQINFE